MSEIQTIKVGNLDIKKIVVNDNDYLCISDFVPKDGTAGSGITIMNWLRAGNTISFLGLWEKINNHNFNVIGYDDIKKNKTEKGNAFSISTTQWVKKTNAIGITSKAGRYNSGTYAHIDIAMEFATWLSPEFKLYLITEFQRLKKEEAERKNELQDWHIFRDFTKMGYKIQTDAIQQNIIPVLNLPKNKEYIIYSSEADLLNIAVFGMKASEFEKRNPNLIQQGKNIRDCASKKALNIINNLQSSNAKMIREGIAKEKRAEELIIQASEEKKSLHIEKEIDLFQHNLFIQIQNNVTKYSKEEKNVIDIIQNESLEFKENNFESTLEKIALSKKPT